MFFIMPQSNSQDEKEIIVADLYPQLTPEQQKEAEYYLLCYLAVVKRIFERIAREDPKLLLELEKRARLRK